MKKRPILIIVSFIFVFALSMFLHIDERGITANMNSVNAATYKIKASTKPCNKKYRKYSTYNKKTKNYYTIRSYLEKLEKKGGGTLILKKGTYTITNVLYVPSKVTIKLSNGTYLKKSMSTGTKKLKPSSTMFQLVNPKKANKKNSAKKYSGAKKINIIGSGKSTIGLGYSTSNAIVSGHNDKVNISGITFKYLRNGAFIQLSGSSNVTIEKCKFYYHKTSSTKSKSAITIDSPDSKLDKASFKWMKRDNTPCKNIIIKNNGFYKLERAIASIKFSKGKYHSNIQIMNNKIKNIDKDSIVAINWYKPSIRGNKFESLGQGSKITSSNITRAISFLGVTEPTVNGNSFKKLARTIQFSRWRNNTSKVAKSYGITKNSISSAKLKDILSNNKVDGSVVEHFIRYNKIYNNTDSKDYYFVDKSNNFTITTGTSPYKHAYMTNPNYNKYTKTYCVFKSYMDQLERAGGGTLYVSSGTYTITNVVPIPSNVKIILKDGAKIVKGNYTGTKSMKPSGYMFVFAKPSTFESASCKDYDGVSNSSIYAQNKGKAYINMNKVTGCGIVLAHNQNCKVENITFYNKAGGHYIEADASKNCLIQNNIFKDGSAVGKEAINLDTPDKITGGFTGSWSSLDKTANYNLKILNNNFSNMTVAIGTHSYSYGHPHENVLIDGNTFSNITERVIQPMNWKNTTISNNKFDCSPSVGTIYVRGANNLDILNNTFNISKGAKIYNFRCAYHSSDSLTKNKVKPVKNSITEENKDNIMNNNTYKGSYDFYVRIYNTYKWNGKAYENGDMTERWNIDTKAFDTLSIRSKKTESYINNEDLKDINTKEKDVVITPKNNKKFLDNSKKDKNLENNDNNIVSDDADNYLNNESDNIDDLKNNTKINTIE